MGLSTTFWIQLLGMIFGAGMMYFTFIKYKRRELNRTELMIWFIGWIALVIVALIPNIFDSLIAPLHFYRRLDFFVVVGFFVLLGLSFFNYSKAKKMERKLERYVRKETLEEVENMNVEMKVKK